MSCKRVFCVPHGSGFRDLFDTGEEPMSTEMVTLVHSVHTPSLVYWNWKNAFEACLIKIKIYMNNYSLYMNMNNYN